MAYDERAVAPGVEVWTSVGSGGEQRILPDGCLDLIFDGETLLVAGPDTTARVHGNSGPTTMTGVRLHAGRGPALLGVPADDLVDNTVALDQVWSDRLARDLLERVAADPVRELARWGSAGGVDPFGLRLRALLASGRSVSEAAGALGYSSRQLHRRAVPLFGYGPQHLGRILRLLRALVAADAGVAWSGVAQRAGYSDQAHLTRDVRALTGTTPTELRRERVRSVQDIASSGPLASPT